MRLTQTVILIHQQKDKEPNSLLVFTEVSSWSCNEEQNIPENKQLL